MIFKLFKNKKKKIWKQINQPSDKLQNIKIKKKKKILIKIILF